MKYNILIMALLIFLFSCKKEEDPHANHDIYYTCSMHPQIVADKPGKCPICHMDLVPVEKKKNADPNALVLNDEQIKLGNIKTMSLANDDLSDKLTLTGTLNFDQYKMHSVSSRVMGRVEKLYYKNIGEYVPQGSPLIEIYSEELNNSKQEYLLALERQHLFKGNTSIDFDQLLQSSRNKLSLWGMTKGQISQLERTRKAPLTTTVFSTGSGYITDLNISEGAYVSEGGTILTLADLSTLWAEAQVYSSQMALIHRDTKVTVSIPDLDNLKIDGTIDFTNPEINSASRINLVRVSIPNKDKLLKPGMPVYVLVENESRKTLTLPTDAVIRDGKMATVWVKTAKNTFVNKMVKTGLETDDRIEILSGIKEDDEVVVSGTYLLNSEYIFQKGADPMAGHEM
ncbi:efflux RND transporter periplasmic adaptor subunit [Kaistella antarctica]|uniref:Cation efflux system protein CusB n=1 Tax=Kaistella antarctica TaxID=266748 RepID=A0A448NMH9_9FLAO|nr:efflux RND transporter periplasmic adaptor subunit [Kaistella antarctica]KEY20157.1 copper transporter [Kaistella antarctica]SEV92993.1 membrane fusion protein, Cu(I)/Ag(I) efflux system [Kaistella antarctica]VEH95067.1 Cation efflux system protein CusB precursor [Kaistella antarctica]